MVSRIPFLFFVKKMVHDGLSAEESRCEPAELKSQEESLSVLKMVAQSELGLETKARIFCSITIFADLIWERTNE